MSETPFAVRVCLWYNRLFHFRTRSDNLVQAKLEAAKLRQVDPRAAELAYAEFEFGKTDTFLAKFKEVPLAGKRVLDFGCRCGGSTARYATLGAESVVGVDVEPWMLETAWEFVRREAAKPPRPGAVPLDVKRVDFRLGGADRLPLDDRSVDVILLEDVVEHLAAPEKIMAEWQRVLAPGGKLYISFGPLWYHPFGIHCWEIFHAPWMHVLFPLKTLFYAKHLLSRRAPPSPEELRRFSCQTSFDLNRMTVSRFKQLLRGTGFRVNHFKLHTVRKLRWVSWMPWVREYLASQVDCVLEKPD